MRMLMMTMVGTLLACSADSDEDGLTNGEERKLGLDPQVADTDGDGLLDGQEVEFGTDGLKADTDGDGYGDRDEIHEGTDPNDASDVIYTGNWPYFFGKDDISGQRGGQQMSMGRRFRRLEMVDQNGEMVDLYDFYNEEDKYVLLDISAEWCVPCQDMAAWLDHQTEGFSEFNAVRDAVDAGDMYWVTIMGDTADGSPVSVALSERWHEAYPTEPIAVLADESGEAVKYADVPFWPFLMLLGPDLKVQAIDSSTDWLALQAAMDVL
ncbi:MAG: hypothetical protein AAGA48_24965 [Myxococcota bacterium]